MLYDDQFRSILLIGFAVAVPIMAGYRIRSNMSREKLDRLQEGWGLFLGIRLLALVSVAGLIAFLSNPDRLAWSAVPLPLWARWLGVGLGVVAVGLIIYTFHHLGRNLTDTVVTRKDHSLIVSGPYRWVRHPFYVACALAFIANGLATANWFIFLTSAAVLVLLIKRTDREEARLIARFGEDYHLYMRRVGRFVPKLGA